MKNPIQLSLRGRVGKGILLFLFSFTASSLCAQEILILSGHVCDYRTHVDLPDAQVEIMTTDSVVIETTVARSEWMNGSSHGVNADFNLVKVLRREGHYIIKVSHAGYETAYVNYDITNLHRREMHRELPPLYLKTKERKLGEAQVSASKIKLYYRGDTAIYNADAFLMAAGSMLSDLVRKLPGVEIRKNGDIYHDGRLVESLLLNGRDFFNGKKEVLLDNLPTYTVKTLAVYDKYGEKSELLGRAVGDDKQYVMDVRLKKEYSIGWLGNVEAGAGTNDRYMGRLFALRFSDHSQLSFYGTMNNLNESRKPGRDDAWNPTDAISGVQRSQLSGFDYNVDARSKRWKAEGNVEWQHTNFDNVTTTNRTNFIQTGNTLQQQQERTAQGTYRLTTSHRLYLKRKQWDLSLRPKFSYEYHHGTSFMTNEESRGQQSLNSSLSQRHAMEHTAQMGLEAHSTIKMKYSSDCVELSASADHQDMREKARRRYDIQYGAASLSRSLLQASRNFPHRTTTLRGKATYDYIYSRHWSFSLGYGYELTRRRDNSSLLSAEATDSSLVLPSMAEAVMRLDANNSYHSLAHDGRHTLTPSFRYATRGTRSHLTLQAYLPLTLLRQQLSYQRGATDTSLVHHRVLAQLTGSYMEWASNDNKYYMGLWYQFDPQVPDLQNCITFHDTTDPLNQHVGNPDLRTAYTHKVHWMLGQKKGLRQGLDVNYSITHNALAMGYTYDPLTGVRTYRQENINGNWNGDLGYYFYTAMKKHFSIASMTEFSHANSVDLMTLTDAAPFRSKVHTNGLSQELRMEGQWGNNSIELNAKEAWDHITGNREGFETLNVFDLKNGVTVNWQLPIVNCQLATDFTVYTRLGYADASLNTTNFVWNVRLSRTLCRGKLLLMLDGFDLLHDLSNVTRTIDAQARTEIFTNVLYHYVMLHVQYHFNLQPKKQLTVDN